jgi:hypothetical protein
VDVRRLPVRSACVAGLLALLLLAFGAVSPALATERPAPINVRLLPGTESLTVRWGVTSTEELAGFRVRWRPGPETPWSDFVERGPAARGYTITGLSYQAYEVRVRTVLSNGELGPIATVTGTPLAPEETPGEEPPPEEETEGFGESWEGLSPQNPLPGNRRFGSDLSPFNVPVGLSPTLPNSSAMVAFLLEHEGVPADVHRPADGSRPLFYASNSDPVLTLRGHDGAGLLNLDGRKIHVPQYAAAEEESDGHLTIVLAPSDAIIPGEAIDFWRATISFAEKVVRASSIGLTQMGPSGSLLSLDGGGSGDAAFFGLQAGLVRAPELEAGTVNHALTAVIDGAANYTVYPAKIGDGSSTDPNAPPIGQRFVLDYTVAEIEALGFKPWKVAILKALIKYGFYVGDSSSERLLLLWEGASTYPGVSPEPFAAVGAEEGMTKSEGRYTFDLARGIDWTRLRAVAPPLG